jgi:O-antigen/teichoic acid export membrane protein
MISTMQDNILNIINFLHIKIFHHQMGEDMKKFITSLSWSFFGGIISSIVMMTINICAGRLMGPVEYGKYNLLITISNFLLIPILFGLNISSVISITNSNTELDKKKNISSPLYYILLNCTLIFILFTYNSTSISHMFSIESTFLLVCLTYTTLTALKSIFETFIKGLCEFKYQFYGKVGEALLISIFFIFIFKGHYNYIYYIYALLSGTIFTIILYFIKVYPFLTTFNFRKLKEQLSYGKVIIIESIWGIIFNSLDKILIIKYLGMSELGIYGAYYTVSTNLIAQLTQMFLNVFFPTISSIKDNTFIKKINKIYFITSIPIFVSLLIIIFLAMKLFGNKYEINFGYIISFSILATLQIRAIINTSIITAISKKIFKSYLYRSSLINLLHLLSFAIIVYFHLVSIQLIIVLYIINIIFIISLQKYLIRNSSVPYAKILSI